MMKTKETSFFIKFHRKENVSFDSQTKLIEPNPRLNKIMFKRTLLNYACLLSVSNRVIFCLSPPSCTSPRLSWILQFST